MMQYRRPSELEKDENYIYVATIDSTTFEKVKYLFLR